MARRGPKGIDPKMKKARGTEQKCRKVETLFADHAARPDPDVIAAPKWLSGAAKKIWKEKTDRYRQRNQKISGFEDTLAQYCELEANLIEIYQRGRELPPVTMINTHRTYAAEFYDTPASQKVPASGAGKEGNKFARNGNRPA